MRCATNARIKQEINDNVTKVLGMFSKYAIEVLVDLLKGRIQDQCCPRCFQRVHLAVYRSGLVVGRDTPCRKYYVEEKIFIRDRPKLWNHLHCVIACPKFGRNSRMQASFVLIVGDGEDGSVVCVGTVLLLPHRNFQTNRSGTENLCLHYVE